MSATETSVQNDVNNQDNAPPDDGADWEGKARSMGWSPKEQFKGDPAKWVDAKTYVERGEQFIPLLQHAKRELQSQVAAQANENADLRRQLAVQAKAMEELRTDFNADSLESAETRKSALVDQIAAAREADDVRLELRLREELDELNGEIRTLKAKPAVVEPKATEPDPTAWQRDPDTQAFITENPWFGHDQEKSSIALGYMNFINGNAETARLSKREKYDLVAKRINELFPGAGNPRRSNASKVEGGRGEAGGGSSGERTYSSLPAAAKEQCDKQAKLFVGRADARGRVKYPDLKAYQAHFAQTYFAEDWGARQMNA